MRFIYSILKYTTITFENRIFNGSKTSKNFEFIEFMDVPEKGTNNEYVAINVKKNCYQ